jgi:1-acyl-sn-glycerol-3-phosphate acyltransferase
MPFGAAIARRAWLTHWRRYQRYHRFEVRGFENLQTDRACLIAGYHGRSIARDMCMLSVYAHDRLGYMPHAIFHKAAARMPVTRAIMEGVDGVAGADEALAEVAARGEHILVTPGGTGEGCRTFRDRYRVNWGRRTGYIRLALRYGLPIVPVAAAGTDDTYIGLNNGDAWSRRLKAPMGLPMWLGVGPLGLWPLSPPFPVKILQLIGEPIELPALDPSDRDGLLGFHARVRVCDRTSRSAGQLMAAALVMG